MIRHLFYKEWLKTRWAFFASLAVGAAVIFYIFTMAENRMTMLGTKEYMLSVLYDNPPRIYYSWLQYIPLLGAVCIGLAQYVPEIKNRRIRLTMHLPVDNLKLISSMALFGLMLITILNVLLFGFFEYENHACFPAEITGPVTATAVNWFIASYLAYNYIGMTAMEPNGYRRLIYAVTGIILLTLYYNGVDFHGANSGSTWFLAVIALLSCPLVLFSTNRLNKGDR